MTKLPLVSVAIPCYNHEKYVQECIQSVIDQDYENIELIIIDDGSSDNSVNVIREMIPACEKRFFRFAFHFRVNKGLSATLNEAIDWSGGAYFSALASDDVMLPQKTSLLVSYIQETQQAGVFSGAQIIDSKGKATGAHYTARGMATFSEIILRKKNVVAPAQLLDLNCLKRVGGYKNELYIEDFYMWLALTEAGDSLGFVEDILVKYRLHGENDKNIMKMYEGRIEVLGCFSKHALYQKAMAINCLVSALYLCPLSKPEAATLLKRSISHYRMIIFSGWFIRCIFSFIAPKALVVKARKLKSFLVGAP